MKNHLVFEDNDPQSELSTLNLGPTHPATHGVFQNVLQLNDVIEIVKAVKIPGIVATNTTINRSTLLAKSSKLRSEMVGAGGLSGRAVHARSVEVVKYLCDRSENKFEVIGVGGIFTGADAQDFLNAGAKLVQVYTGFIYEGPSIVKKINKALFQ